MTKNNDEATMRTAENVMKHLPSDAARRFLTGMASVKPESETSRKIRELRDSIK